MTRNHSVKSPTGQPLGRRSLLGLIGAVPVATGGAWVLSGSAEAGGAKRPSPAGSEAFVVPVDLRPKGEFDRFLADLAARDAFSGTMLVVHGERTVLEHNFGMADKARAIPNSTDTVYCLASVTKLFTAVAIAQLVQQGKVKYDGKLGAYVDGFPAAAADHVTVHQLLTHTAGMGDYHALDGYLSAAAGWKSADEVLSGTMDFIRKAPLDYTPGTGHQYSNSAYTVLGAIVQEVSGQSYYEYIRQHVFAAAGMTSSDFYTRPQWQSDRRIAQPYSRQPSGPSGQPSGPPSGPPSGQPSGPRVDVVDQQVFTGLPDGDAFATAPDLVRFVKALRDGKLLEPAYADLVVGAKVPAATLPPKPGLPGKSIYEAYGPAAVLRNGKWAVGHNGGSAGKSTLVEWYPPTDWIAVKLSNYDPQDTMIVDDKIQGILTQ